MQQHYGCILAAPASKVKGGQDVFKGGKILKKSSVFTNLYRKMPICLDFTQIRRETGGENARGEQMPAYAPYGIAFFLCTHDQGVLWMQLVHESYSTYLVTTLSVAIEKSYFLIFFSSHIIEAFPGLHISNLLNTKWETEKM